MICLLAQGEGLVGICSTRARGRISGKLAYTDLPGVMNAKGLANPVAFFAKPTSMTCGR